MFDKAYLKRKLMSLLKKLRCEALLKQGDVGNCIGTSGGYYGQMERCVREMDFDIFLDLMYAYKKRPWEILKEAWQDDIDFEKEAAALQREVEWKKKKPKWIKNAKRREVYKKKKLENPKPKKKKKKKVEVRKGKRKKVKMRE